MLPTMFTTCRVAFMFVSPVVRMLGAATTCGNAARSGSSTLSTREADRGATADRAQLSAHEEGTPGATLDEQDRLAVAEHAGQAARDVAVEVTAGDDDDDVGALHRRRELGRHELERREPCGQAFDVEPAALPHLGDARLVAIMQAETIAK